MQAPSRLLVHLCKHSRLPTYPCRVNSEKPLKYKPGLKGGHSHPRGVHTLPGTGSGSTLVIVSLTTAIIRR